jgi:chromosome partitioning protein
VRGVRVTTAVPTGWLGPEPSDSGPTGWIALELGDTTHSNEAGPDPAPPVSRETTGSGIQPEPQAAVSVSRETSRQNSPFPAVVGVTRAADLTADTSTGSATPMARAAQSVVSRRLRLAEQPALDPPEQPRVIVVANQKGGVGKTTSTVNLAAALAMAGQRVVVLDLDPQGNAGTAFGVDHSEGTPGSYEVLVDGLAIADLLQRAPDLDNVRVLPASIDLAGAEIELVSMVARETRLKRALDSLLADDEAIDYVLVDCPPSLGLLTVNAMVAAQELLIPIQCEYYALEGLGQLQRNIELVRAHLNPALHVSAILLTMYDARTRLAAQVAQEVRDHFGERVLGTAIPRSVRISEAPSYQQTVMQYDPTSPGALSYAEAARELAGRGTGASAAPAVPAARAGVAANAHPRSANG